jgi:hypothetical protein
MLGGRPRNFVPKLRPPGYGQVIAKGNYLPTQLPMAIVWPMVELSLKSKAPALRISKRCQVHFSVSLNGCMF